MKKILISSLFLIAVVALSACSSFRFPGVYRIDIPQGNIIQEEEIAQLQLGMSREQVRYILGSPLSGNDFRPNTWSYVYTNTKGGELLSSKRLDVSFNEKDELIDIQQ